MEASLTCAVCLGVFRDPVTLPQCSHNFCKSCVAECAEPASRLFPASTTSVSVPCPLCRKVSQVYGGPSQLPINTTLAELARLLSPSGGATTQEKPLQSPALAGHCSDHPEHRLELFCKNCSRACCGKCVSAAHHGIFHSVNLLDMVYQEEKLMFFNSLKKLREMYEKVTKEGLDEDYDVKNILQNNTDMVNAAFDEMQKALDLKRQHLLDFIKQQESETLKRQEVWKRTTAHHKITLQHLLRDSEAIVNEVEPECFLKVACSLNQRQTDVNEILKALPILFSAAAFLIDATLESPVQNQELCYLQGQLQKLTIRLFSITEMPEYRHLSFEELRMKYMRTRLYGKMMGLL
ncbi:LOW QUALITY PROTEIN: tripartite motif-containing protein 59-like [Gastrophryne carolinensis]